MITLLLPLLAIITPSATTWTVNASGGADFTTIGAAVAQVAAGDVLLVEPGAYEGFELTKRLAVLGRAGGTRPHVTGDVRVAADNFTLAGFDIDQLHVTGVAGRGRIDDCRIGVATPAYLAYAVDVDTCAQLVISRTRVYGSDSYGKTHSVAGTGVSINSSRVTLVDCIVLGAWGHDGGETYSPQIGGTSLLVIGSSTVLLAGTSLYGGSGGWPFAFNGGAPGGPALSVGDSTVVVRGDSLSDLLWGGEPGLGWPLYGESIHADHSTVVSSGVKYNSGALSFSNSLFIQPVVAEPFVSVGGSAVPGSTSTVALHGPLGATALLVASITPGLGSLGKFEGALWFDPSAVLALVPVVMSGQNSPANLSVLLPAATAGVEGLSFELQPFFPGSPGALDPTKMLAGNVAELIIRF